MFADILGIAVILAMAFPVAGVAYAQDLTPRVGLVNNMNATQDNDFNWMAQQGLLQAETELGVLTSVYQPGDQNEYDYILQQCANENDLCIAIGFDYGVSLANAARVNTSTQWGIVDYSYPDCWEDATQGVDCGSFTELSNVRGLRFNEKQAGYLAGVLAAGMTTSNVVGAVGGMDIPPVVAFMEGYRNGAQCTNPTVNVLTTYTGTFIDPELGVSTAHDMIWQGVDVIFGAAGLTGNGALLYSAQNGQWAIGVDTDQYFTIFGNGTVTGSDKILSSAMKRVDNAVYQTIYDFVHGTFSSGTVIYDLAMDGVGLAPFHETDGSISQAIKDRLAIVRQGIIDGMVNIDACPWLIAFPENDAVEAWEWPEGTTVTLTIDNAPEDFVREGTAEVTSWGDPRTYVRFEFGGEDGYDLQVGDMVTLTDQFGQITTHKVQPLSITGVDRDTNIVAGTAEVDAQLQVWAHEQLAPAVDVSINGDGTWQADLTDVFDITYGTGGRAWVIVEGGNATAVDWYVPNPHFTVFPEWEWFDGYEWPDGLTVYISVEGKDVCDTEGSSSDYFFNGGFPEGCNIEIGDTVTFSDGETDRSHTVRNLSVTKVDPGEDIVKGVADANTEIHVWPHATGQEQLVTTNPKGKWNVSFMGVYDLMPGDGGRAEIRDEFGNATAVDWYIPRPHFTVFPEWEWFDGMDWNDGTAVTITVKNKPECTTIGESWGYFFNGGFPEGCDVVIGDTVKFSDGITKRTHIVQNLDVTTVDMDENTVSGTADAGTTVYVWPHDSWFEPLQVVADDSGFWQVDLDDAGYDILDDTAGRAEIRDDVDNATAVDWYVPHPRFTVFPLWQWFDGVDWPDGTVNITVSGKCTFDKESRDYFFNGGFPADCGFGVGDIVTFDDGNTKREHKVHNIAITAIDLGNDTISGTADAGTVYVWAHDGEFEPLQVPVNEFGVWTANLSDMDYNIQEGSSGRAEIRDDMGNATAVDWSLNPRLIVHTENDWFRAEGFLPNTTLNFWIYDFQGGNQLLASTTAQTDSSGTVIHWVGETMNIVPGNQVVVSDGTSTRDVVLEALTFDVFDTTLGILQGTAPAPFGRTVSFGIGCWQRDDLTGDIITDNSGVWTVDLGGPVPNDFGCVFAWIYDGDGDISEARPEQVIWWDE